MGTHASALRELIPRHMGGTAEDWPCKPPRPTLALQFEMVNIANKLWTRMLANSPEQSVSRMIKEDPMGIGQSSMRTLCSAVDFANAEEKERSITFLQFVRMLLHVGEETKSIQEARVRLLSLKALAAVLPLAQQRNKALKQTSLFISRSMAEHCLMQHEPGLPLARLDEGPFAEEGEFSTTTTQKSAMNTRDNGGPGLLSYRLFMSIMDQQGRMHHVPLYWRRGYDLFLADPSSATQVTCVVSEQDIQSWIAMLIGYNHHHRTVPTSMLRADQAVTQSDYKADAVAHVAAKEWACSLCTCKNPETSVDCSACGMRKHHVQQLLQDQSTFRRSRRKPGQPVTMSSPLNIADMWTCEYCTLQNEDRALLCSMCNAKRPVKDYWVSMLSRPSLE